MNEFLMGEKTPLDTPYYYAFILISFVIVAIPVGLLVFMLRKTKKVPVKSLQEDW